MVGTSASVAPPPRVVANARSSPSPARMICTADSPALFVSAYRFAL
jgi:hypothetical protein